MSVKAAHKRVDEIDPWSHYNYCLNISLEIVFDVEAIKECCDEAIVAFGGKPISGSGSDLQRTRRPDEAVGLSQDLFHSPPRVEMAFKQVLKNMTVGEIPQ